MKTRELTIVEKSVIVALHEEGVSLTDLATSYGINCRTVSRICSGSRVTGSIANLHRSGRPRMTTVRQDRRLRMLQRQHPTATSRDICRQFFANENVILSPSTVRSGMLSFGLKSRIGLKKPVISKTNKAKRLRWAYAHRHWSVQQWKKDMFSDEAPFSMLQINQRRYTRCYRSEILNPGMTRPILNSGGGSVMYWGCFQGNNIRIAEW